MRAIPSPRPAYAVGDCESFTKTITEADVTTYAGLVGDFNPLYVDAEYARRSRYGRRTAPSMLAAGLVAAVLHNRLPGPDTVELSQRMEFLAPIFIGDTVTARVEVIAWQPEKRLVTLLTECFKQDHQQVITGQAAFLVTENEAPEHD